MSIQMPKPQSTLVVVEVEALPYAEQANGKRGKRWQKSISAVDPTKRGGYALEGDWLREGRSHIPVGTVVLRISESNAGSYGHPRLETSWEASTVQEDGSLSPIATSQSSSWATDAVEALMEYATAGETPDEVASLAERIAALPDDDRARLMTLIAA